MTAQEFVDVFPRLADEVLDEVRQLNFPADAIKYLEQMVNYTVPGGKMNRGLSVFDSYKLLNPRFTVDQKLQADVLGWCVEWLQAFFLVADDIMDHSQTRRGQPCWYRQPKVGQTAINDSFLLESFIYRLLKKHFRSSLCYVDLLEVMHEVTYQTELGQLMDLLTAPEGDVDLNRFSIERYTLIVQYKTAYYSFYLPVALALILAGFQLDRDTVVFDKARDILIPMGIFFQVQDDYLDCFGEPEKIGKIGTDIQDNKCSWLVVQALDLCNDEQRRLLHDNYGQHDSDKVEAVKKLYRELDLPAVYRRYEDESYGKIEQLIGQLDDTVIPQQIFKSFSAKIYKRQK